MKKKTKQSAFSSGIYLRDTSYPLPDTGCNYGYPGGWSAMMKDIDADRAGRSILPVEFWKSNTNSMNRGVSMTMQITEYCTNNRISCKQLATREGIHMRSMRGVMNGHRTDDVTQMRLKYGIGKISKENLIKYLTICKKDKKYEKYTNK